MASQAPALEPISSSRQKWLTNRSRPLPPPPPCFHRPIHYYYMGRWFNAAASRRRAASAPVLCASQTSDVAATPESAEANREEGGQHGHAGHGSGKPRPPKT